MSHWLEQVERESEFFARYDYVNEAYGATARSCNEAAADYADECRELEIEERMTEGGITRAQALADMAAEQEEYKRITREQPLVDNLPF